VGNGYFVPGRYQNLIESFFTANLTLLKDTVGTKFRDIFMPFIFSIFSFLLFSNLLGLIPYSFTISSHLVVTLLFAFALWVGKLIVGFKLHASKLFSILLPQGAPFGMVLFLVAIELTTFVMTVISLSVRLFANMMAGHILLKVFAGFAFTMLVNGGFLYILHYFPLIVLLMLLGLELGVALVQA